MSKKGIFILFLISLFVLSTIEVSTAEKKLSSTPMVKDKGVTDKATSIETRSKSKTLSPNVEKFLTALKKAPSIEALAKDFGNVKFTEAEKRQLKTELQKSPYKSKVNSLERKAKSSLSKETNLKAEKTAKQIIRKLEVKQREKQTLRNRKAQNVLSGIKAKKLDKSAVPFHLTAIGMKKLDPAAMLKLRSDHRPPEMQNVPTIHSVRPASVNLGDNVTISGRNFGSAGRVDIVFEDGDVSRPAQVVNWSPSSIVITIPSDIMPWIGEREKPALVWVIPRNETVYWPSEDITIIPDMSYFTPEITRLSSDTISPGDVFVIEGRNFLDGGGMVSFIIPGARTPFRGQLDEWTDSYIALRLEEDIHRLPRTASIVKIRNRLGQETTRSITFEPTIVYHNLHASSLGVALFFGFHEEKTLFRFNLQNGWYVSSEAYYARREICVGCGCDIISAPTIGSNRPTIQVELWADFLGGVRCDWNVPIGGPSGMPYR